METNETFLQAILANPQDNLVLLVYADWLEERGEPDSLAKAEFLRLTAQQLKQDSGSTDASRQECEARDQRLQELAADLDTDWLQVVSRMPIENCQSARPRRMELRFDFMCGRRWEEMGSTASPSIRFCESCKQNVHYCDTIIEAREHALQRHCIAVDLGVIRKDGDLETRLMMAVLGRPSPESVRSAAERVKPDKVSAARERRKRRNQRRNQSR
jgi:uncharacterized protein (TIGR02996 family)